MLKRTTALLLALLMMAGLAACGDSGGGSPSPSTSVSPSVSPSASPSVSPSTAPTESTEPEPSDPFAGRETVDMGFFTVAYPEGWTYNEDDAVQRNASASIQLYDGEEKKESDHWIKINASEEDAYHYRDDMYSKFGVDLHDLADGKLETKTIAGVDFLVTTDSFGDPYYTYRDEPSGFTCHVEFMGETEDDEAVEELLAGLQLTLPDNGNTDAPWPWDGEPFQPTLTEQLVGSYTVVPEYVPFEEPNWTMDIMDHKFYLIGDQLYHLMEKKLDTYEYAADGVKYVSTMDLDTKCEYISTDGQGTLLISPGIGKVFGVKDGQKVLETTVTGDLAMHPSGQWGISFWVSSDTLRATSQSGTMTAEPWILTGLNKPESRQGPFSMVKDVEVTDNHIMVSGNKADDNKTIIVVYDLNGNPLMTFGDVESGSDDSLGSITGMAETANGFVAIDGNSRRVRFWSKDGTHLGSVRANDMFGTDYPWLEDMQLLDDGSLLIMATDRRADQSADEIMLFRLTGF